MNETKFFPDLPEGEWSVAALKAIAGLAGDSIISQIWFTVNSGCAVLATMYLIYLVVIGTANTAHSGETFGRWSTLWVPARIILAIGLISPLPPNGLNTVQYVFYGFSRLGISFATGIYQTALDELGSKAIPLATIRSPKLEQFGKGYFMAQVCAISTNMVAQQLGHPDGFIIPRKVPSEDWITVSFDGNKRHVVGTNTCGAYKIQQKDTALREAQNKLINVSGAKPPVAEQIMLDRIAIINEFTQAVQPVAWKMAEAGINGTEMPTKADAAIVADALDQMQSAMTERVAQLLQDYRQNAKQNARAVLDELVGAAGQSWTMAGLWFYRISEVNGVIMRASSAVPQTVLATYEGLGKDTATTVQRVGDITSRWWDAQLSAVGHRETLERAYTAGTNDIWSTIGVKDLFVRALVINSAANPIGDLVSFGHGLINAFFAGITIVATISGAVEAFDKVGGPVGLVLSWTGSKAAAAFVGGLLKFGGNAILIGLLALLTPGIQLAYLLPFSPVQYWILSLASYFIRFALAFFGAPLWAIAHMSPAGDQLIPEHAQAGYGLLLEVLFRPVVMIVGLFIGMMINIIMADYVTRFFYTAIRASSGDNMDFIVGAIVSVFLVVTLMTGISNICFRLIATAQDELMTLIGFRSSGDGEKAVGQVDRTQGQAAIGSTQIQGVTREAAGSPRRPPAGTPGRPAKPGEKGVDEKKDL